MKLNRKTILICIFAAAVFVGFSLCPPLDGHLTTDSMRVLGILIACVIMWASRVVHECAVVLLMSALMAGVGHVPVGTVFAAFNGSIMWVLIAAFILGAAMKRCGLLRRIALLLLKVFPKNFTGTAIGLMVVSAVIAPFVPSKNAKGAIVGPVVRSISDSMGYAPKSRQAHGLFLSFWTATMAIPFMAVSGSTSTIASRGLLPEEVQAKFTIAAWALYSLPFMIPLMVLMAIFCVRYYGPRKGEKVGNDLTSEFLDAQLAELGPWSREEKIVGILSVAMILYWVFKERLGNIPDFASCLLVLAIFWFTNCLDAKTFRNDVSWENVIFIGCCISLGSILPYAGITDWIVSVVGPYTNAAFANPFLTIVVLVVMLCAVRFLLLSEGSYIAVMCALLYPLALSAGVNPWVVAMIVNAVVGEFFLPYQNSAFLSGYYSFGDDAFDSGATRFYWVVFVIIATVSLCVACVIWQMMGLWWL